MNYFDSQKTHGGNCIMCSTSQESNERLLWHLKYLMLDITIKLVSNALNSECMECDWPCLKNLAAASNGYINLTAGTKMGNYR